MEGGFSDGRTEFLRSGSDFLSETLKLCDLQAASFGDAATNPIFRESRGVGDGNYPNHLGMKDIGERRFMPDRVDRDARKLRR